MFSDYIMVKVYNGSVSSYVWTMGDDSRERGYVFDYNKGLHMLTHRESRFLTAKKLSYRGRIIQPCCWRLPARVCVSVYLRSKATSRLEQRLQFKGCAACAESGALVAIVELGSGVFPERSREFFDLIN